MLVRPAEQSFGKGLEALERGEGVKALALFEAAIRLDRQYRGERPQPRYLSYYGLCLGLESKRWKEAVDLCRDALAAESYNPDLHLNLGRVLLAAGRRKEGFETLRRGLEVDDQHEGLHRALTSMGSRRRPALPFLSRNHPLNKLLGKMAHQDAARKNPPARGAKTARTRRRTAPGRA
jgi:predicted Zn-dependent protease